MDRTLNVLIVEDNPRDAELMLHELRRYGFAATPVQVEVELEFIAQLLPSVDVILADYHVPNLGAARVLQLLRDREVDTPCIVVTGMVSEEIVVACMRQGAVDYLLKDRMSRLGPAVERALAEKQLRDEQRRSKQTLEHQALIIENVSDAIVATDMQLQITSWNPAAEAVYGWTRDQVLGRPLGAILAQDVFPEIREQLIQVLLNGAAWTGELQQRHRDGARLTVLASVNVIRNDKGRPVGIVSVNRDITERKRAQAALEQSEREFRTLAENVPDMIARFDAECRLSYVNRAVEKELGRSPEYLLGKTHRDIGQQAEMADGSESQIRQVFETGREVAFETSLPTGEGTKYYLTRGVPEFGPDGSVRSALFIYRNITERRMAEAALRASEVRYRHLVESSHDWIWEVNPDGVYTMVGPQCKQLLGYSPEELAGKRPFDLMLPDEREKVGALFASISARQEPFRELENRNLTKDGRTVILETNGVPMYDPSGTFAGYRGTDRDITQRKKIEETLRRQNDFLSALQDTALDIVSQLDPDRLLENIVVRACELFGTSSGSLHLVEPGAERTKPKVGVGPLAEALLLPNTRNEGLTGKVWDTGQPFAVDDYDAWTGRAEEISPGIVGSAVSVPLLADSGVVGVLGLAYDRSNPRTFGAEAVESLTWFARLATIAIQNAHLYSTAQRELADRRRAEEQTQLHLKRLDALHSIDMAISSSLDLPLTLGIVLNHIVSELKADAADVWLLDSSMPVLEYVVGQGFHSPAAMFTRLRLGDGYAGQAALQRRVVQIPDLAQLPATSERARLFAKEEFRSYYAVPLIAKGVVKGVLEVFHRAPFSPDSEWLGFLEALGVQTAIAMDNMSLFANLQRSNAELAIAYETTLEGWSRALDLRDKETEGHTLRVVEKTIELAYALGMSDEDQVHVRRGALLHDIGKMGIPDHILLKPGPLTDEEWVIMRRHPEFARDLLRPIAFLRQALDIPYCHHEKWDGTGYPRGLKGEQIPLSARAFAIVDVWDALRSDRPYRAAWDEERVRAYLREQAGAYFDPQVVDRFLRQ